MDATEKINVLLVEDDGAATALIEETLSGIGYRVSCAQDGVTGFDMAQAGKLQGQRGHDPARHGENARKQVGVIRFGQVCKRNLQRAVVLRQGGASAMQWAALLHHLLGWHHRAEF